MSAGRRPRRPRARGGDHGRSTTVGRCSGGPARPMRACLPPPPPGPARRARHPEGSSSHALPPGHEPPARPCRRLPACNGSSGAVTPPRRRDRATTSPPRRPAMPSGFVLTQTNDAHDNELLAYRRDEQGRITAIGGTSTKGAGTGTAHLPSQGSVVLTGNGRHALVANAGSGDLAVFALPDDGPAHVQTIAAGAAPRSVAERDGLVYALATGEPSVLGFRWEGTALAPIAGSRRSLPDG